MIGGISSWSMAIADTLHAAGEAVVVYRRPGPAVDRPYPVRTMWGRSWRRWQGLWAALAVRPRLRPGDRVLCATWPLAEFLVGCGFPVAISGHGSDLSRPSSRRARVLSQADALWPVSEFLGKQMGFPYTVLPYPIVPVTPARRGEALLCIARLGPLKGVDRVLRLGARLGRPVVVVGDGPERVHLENLATELRIPVRFCGALPPEEIPWDGTWALALLSRPDADGTGAEGLGLVLLEAAARGIPTLGTAVGGIPEAASVVLSDPDHDEVAELPSPMSLEAWLRTRHGPSATLKVLNSLLSTAENGL